MINSPFSTHFLAEPEPVFVDSLIFFFPVAVRASVLKSQQSLPKVDDAQTAPGGDLVGCVL